MTKPTSSSGVFEAVVRQLTEKESEMLIVAVNPIQEDQITVVSASQHRRPEVLWGGRIDAKPNDIVQLLSGSALNTSLGGGLITGVEKVHFVWTKESDALHLFDGKGLKCRSSRASVAIRMKGDRWRTLERSNIDHVTSDVSPWWVTYSVNVHTRAGERYQVASRRSFEAIIVGALQILYTDEDAEFKTVWTWDLGRALSDVLNVPWFEDWREGKE